MADGRYGIVVCDGAGRLSFASEGITALVGDHKPESGSHVGELFSGSPDVASWVAGAVTRVAESTESESTTIPTGSFGVLRLTASRLHGASGRSVAVVFESVKPVDNVALPSEVARKTWHDIQNQLGGLKLYATFLKRKLGSADDQLRETADKIVQGVDAVSQSIANARRGEEGKE